MTPFEYLLALVSVLVGLAIADLAASLHRLLRTRRTVRWDGLPLATALVVALVLLGFWWQFYSMGHDDVWTNHGSFLVLATYLFCLVLLASAALPDPVPARGIDLREYYRNSHRYFWSLFAFTLVLRDPAAWVSGRVRSAATPGEPLNARVARRLDHEAPVDPRSSSRPGAVFRTASCTEEHTPRTSMRYPPLPLPGHSLSPARFRRGTDSSIEARLDQPMEFSSRPETAAGIAAFGPGFSHSYSMVGA